MFHNLLIKCVNMVKDTVPDSSDRRLRTAFVLLRLLWRYLDANMTGATVQMNTPAGNKNCDTALYETCIASQRNLDVSY